MEYLNINGSAEFFINHVAKLENIIPVSSICQDIWS